MSKSVYSLVLTDEVVREIDRMAYQSGTNRSNMINQILAERVSYITPEKRIERIFNAIESMLGMSDTFRKSAPASDTMLQLNSSLAYKYNPNVKYSVELYRDDSEALGEMRVSMRTQNTSLIMALLDFYELWTSTEKRFIGESPSGADRMGRFFRRIKPRINRTANSGSDTETLGGLIAQYIRAFDSALKAYFYNLSTPHAAVREVEDIYREYLSTSPHII